MTFFEIIDNLIDDSEVPPIKRKGEDYDSARSSIHSELSNLEDVEVACHHEAAHWVYAVLAANHLRADSSLFQVVGPRILYDSLKNKPYDSAPTGLLMVGVKDWRAQTEQDVRIMARIAMAGGESVRHFYGPNRKRGDSDDLERFDAFCKVTRMRLGSVIQAPHIYRDEAKEDIRKDFADERFKMLVQTKANLVKQEQFGPVFGFYT